MTVPNDRKKPAVAKPALYIVRDMHLEDPEEFSLRHLGHGLEYTLSTNKTLFIRLCPKCLEVEFTEVPS